MNSYAAELVDLKPDVIVAAATPALAAIAQKTPSIPIVFVNVADPVRRLRSPISLVQVGTFFSQNHV